MKALHRIVLLVAVGAIALPVAAGEGHTCTASTQDCLNHMVSQLAHRGWIGIEAKDETMEITRVVDGSPADAAGLMVGDVLRGVNGVMYADASKEQLQNIKQSMTPGTSVTLLVQRDDHTKSFTITLAPLPDNVRAQWIGAHMLEHATVKVASK